MDPALRVASENAPLGVTRRLFGVTKLRSSCLDWCIFRHNSDDSNSVNRPWQIVGSDCAFEGNLSLQFEVWH